ncbi:MAG TPA: hypothetical protein VGJ87_15295 [Roseiflexaceae bacterium]|jgi:hypothetical protein
MSDTGGLIRRGKKDPIVVVEIQGELPPNEWDELVAKLRALAKKYPNLKVNVLGGKKSP